MFNSIDLTEVCPLIYNTSSSWAKDSREKNKVLFKYGRL